MKGGVVHNAVNSNTFNDFILFQISQKSYYAATVKLIEKELSVGFKNFVNSVGFFSVVLFFSYASLAADQGGVDIQDQVVGNGDEATPYSEVTVHYTGRLENGEKFDSSLDRGQPFIFKIGAGQVIPGWERGVRGMKVGGKRTLIIPPKLAYGQRGAGGVIPPNATLTFDIELLAVAAPAFQNIGNEKLKTLLDQGVTVVDVRRVDEWNATGVIKGSKRLTAFNDQGQFVRTFIDDLAKITAKDKPVILICRIGNRSVRLANFLSDKLGYTNIYNVTDGIVGWIEGKNPVDK